MDRTLPPHGPRLRGLALVGLFLLGGPGASAQPMDQERTVNGYTLRWSTAVTGFLPHKAVQNHQLAPTGRGVLNVVVLESGPDDALPQTVGADVDVTAVNQAEQLRTITMRPVVAQERTSYVGSFEVNHRDVLNFTIRVEPWTADKPFSVAFERQFFLREEGTD